MQIPSLSFKLGLGGLGKGELDTWKIVLLASFLSVTLHPLHPTSWSQQLVLLFRCWHVV